MSGKHESKTGVTDIVDRVGEVEIHSHQVLSMLLLENMEPDNLCKF